MHFLRTILAFNEYHLSLMFETKSILKYNFNYQSYRFLTMDRISNLLSQFSLHAGIFYSGSICGIHEFDEDLLQGHIHLIKHGSIQVIGVQNETISIIEPTLLFLPRPGKHRLIADDRAGAEVICGTVRFGGGGHNPITDSLPGIVLIKISDMPDVETLLNLLFDEAFSERCGRQAALDRLCEVLMIRVLRHCLDLGLTQGGTLGGLTDNRLAKALVAIHADPAREWKLIDMAALAGMSRARFAVRFREIIGDTPADYLASWRVMTAQRLLRQGLQLKHVAYDVGYGSAGALARAFIRKLGSSPSEWLKGEDEIKRSSKPDTPRHLNETYGTRDASNDA